MKQRQKWIDIAKGLMIIGMVLNHITNYSLKMGVDLSVFPWNFTIGRAYGVFTMQSFFILSGYTTNYDQDICVFFKKQIKGLLLPYLSFMLIFQTIANFVWGEPFIMEMYGEKYFFLVEGYWFLTALFFAKVVVFFLHKFTKNNNLLVLGGVLFYLLQV